MQCIHPVDRRFPERNDNVALFNTRKCRRTLFLDAVHEDTVRLDQSEQTLHVSWDRYVGARDAEIPAADASVANEQCRHALRGRRRNRKAESAAAARNDRRVDADHRAARIDERAAAIAGIQRRVGLDDVVHQASRTRTQRTSERRNDAGRYGTFEAEGVAEGDRQLARLDRARVAEHRRDEVAARNAQHGEVGVRVVAGHDTAKAAPVEERNVDFIGAVHHVRIGEHEAVGGGDEARAAARPPAAAPDVDADHGGAGAFDGARHDA